jgi:hypothetical protein
MDTIRYRGKWYRINPKPYEPERQTSEIAWMLVREPLVLKEEAYRKYFEKQRLESKVLYPTFNKNDFNCGDSKV